MSSTTRAESEFVTRLHQVVSRLAQIERSIAIFLFGLLIMTMGTAVFARYVLHKPFSWSEELSRFALIWMSFLSSAFVMAEDKHISVDLWSSRLSVRSNRGLQLMGYVVIVAVCLTLFVGGLRFVWYVRPVGSSTLGISKGLWYASLSVGLLLMAFHATANFVFVLLTGKPFCESQPRDSAPSHSSLSDASYENTGVPR